MEFFASEENGITHWLPIEEIIEEIMRAIKIKAPLEMGKRLHPICMVFSVTCPECGHKNEIDGADDFFEYPEPVQYEEFGCYECEHEWFMRMDLKPVLTMELSHEPIKMSEAKPTRRLIMVLVDGVWVEAEYRDTEQTGQGWRKRATPKVLVAGKDVYRDGLRWRNVE